MRRVHYTSVCAYEMARAATQRVQSIDLAMFWACSFQLLGCGRIILLFIQRAESRDTTTLCAVAGAHIREGWYMII